MVMVTIHMHVKFTLYLYVYNIQPYGPQNLNQYRSSNDRHALGSVTCVQICNYASSPMVH